jgi:hypothetical protein
VRTASDRVYIFAADDTAQRQGTGAGVIRVWKANTTGIPTGFTEVDTANRPTSAGGSGHVLVSVDARMDSAGTVHVIYVDEANGNLTYRTFSPATDSWGAPTVIASGVNANFYTIKRSRNAAALALDNADNPSVVYASGASLVYRARIGGSWTAPTTISNGGFPVHPQFAFDAAGNLYLAWLDDNQPTSASIRYLQRTAGGTWLPQETVADSSVVQDNSTGDQGPSMVVTASGRPYVLWITPRGSSWIRIKYRTPSGWSADDPASNLYTHAPQIYAKGDDVYAFLGHDDQIRFGYDYHPSGQSWAPYRALTSAADGTLDGSASVRWDPPRDNNPGVIDTAFFDEDKNDNGSYVSELYYMAVLPSGAASSDTTPPSVSVTSPAAGSSVSGVVGLSASASDDVGVAGVQFLVDGVAVGAEDTAAPFSGSWDSSSVANGSHTVSAVARDASGNRTTSAAVAVTVSNAGSPPPPAPTGLVAAWAFNEGSGSSVADASGNGHAGSLTSTAWSSAGKFGSALSFNGSSSMVTVGDANDLDFSSAFTLEAWVSPSSLGATWRTVLFKENGSGMAYSLYANQGSGLPVGQVNLGGERNAVGTAGLPLNAWSHLALTYDRTNLRLYVNASLVATTAVTGTLAASNGALRIGGNSVWPEWFAGLIDEVRLYNRALTASEIQTDRNTPIK